MNIRPFFSIKNSIEFYKTFYDLGKLMFAGVFLIRIQQGNMLYAMMSLFIVIMLFITGNFFERRMPHV